MVKTSAKQFGNYFGHMNWQRKRQAEAEVQILPTTTTFGYLSLQDKIQGITSSVNNLLQREFFSIVTTNDSQIHYLIPDGLTIGGPKRAQGDTHVIFITRSSSFVIFLQIKFINIYRHA